MTCGSSTDRRSGAFVRLAACASALVPVSALAPRRLRLCACAVVGAFVRLGVGAFVRLGLYAGGGATPVSAFFGFEQTFVVSLGAGASWKTTPDSGRSEHQIS